MILSTSTNLLWERPDQSILPLEESLSYLREAGFRYIDMNFYDWALPGSPFLTDRWEYWIEGVATRAEALGLSFQQGHAYTFDIGQMRGEELTYHKKLMYRSIECLAHLNTKTVVTHPAWVQSMRVCSDSKEETLRFIDELLPVVDHYGMELAFENMVDTNKKRKYYVTPEEIDDFLQTVNDRRVGLCWDFEHGYIMRFEQKECLRYLGKWLKATHVSDTWSDTDTDLMHVPPLMGQSYWWELMPVLEEIQYKGCFSLETHNFTNKIPIGAIPTALSLVYQLTEQLIEKSRK